MARGLSVAIVGAGIGGLTAAAAMLRAGLKANVYEQAHRFTRLGAGIQQGPNATRVLRELGLEPHLRRIGFLSLNRQWGSKALTNIYELGDMAEREPLP